MWQPTLPAAAAPRSDTEICFGIITKTLENKGCHMPIFTQSGFGGAAVAKALGLDPKNVRQIDLRFCAGELVTVKVESFATMEGIEGVVRVLETNEYELRPISKSEEFPHAV